MKNDGITVNGIILDEFLKDKDAIEEQIEREKLVSENTPETSVYYKPRERYKPHNEKNGKVRKLDQKEINESIYEETMCKQLRNMKYKHAIAIFFMASGHTGWVTQRMIREEFIRICDKHNIKITKYLQPVISKHFIFLRDSKLFADHFEIKQGNPLKYRMDDSILDKYNLDTIVKLSDKAAPKPAPKPKAKPEINLPIRKDISEEVKVEKEVENDKQISIGGVINEAIKALQGLTLNGGINIHIHLK